jgi:glycosyltransferase involved in cell wall biosynthesis
VSPRPKGAVRALDERSAFGSRRRCGDLNDSAKVDLLRGGACALLLPIDWPEPFGLVMIEAMACATPYRA